MEEYLGVRLARASRHFREAWPFAVAIAGVIISSIVSYFTAANLSDQVRHSGTILQALGLIVVAIGISQVRQLFGRPSLFSRAVAWVKGLPRLIKRPAPVVLSVDPVKMTMSVGTPTIVLGRKPNATVDERLDWLERNLDRLDAETRKTADEHTKRISDVRGQLKTERSERNSQIRELSKRLEEVSVGGIQLESIGLTWLLLGVLGTSIPAEIAGLLSLFRM